VLDILLQLRYNSYVNPDRVRGHYALCPHQTGLTRPLPEQTILKYFPEQTMNLAFNEFSEARNYHIQRM